MGTGGTVEHGWKSEVGNGSCKTKLLLVFPLRLLPRRPDLFTRRNYVPDSPSPGLKTHQTLDSRVERTQKDAPSKRVSYLAVEYSSLGPVRLRLRDSAQEGTRVEHSPSGNPCVHRGTNMPPRKCPQNLPDRGMPESRVDGAVIEV